MMQGEQWEQVDKLRQHAGAVTWRLYEAVGRKAVKTQTPDP